MLSGQKACARSLSAAPAPAAAAHNDSSTGCCESYGFKNASLADECCQTYEDGARPAACNMSRSLHRGGQRYFAGALCAQAKRTAGAAPGAPARPADVRGARGGDEDGAQCAANCFHFEEQGQGQGSLAVDTYVHRTRRCALQDVRRPCKWHVAAPPCSRPSLASLSRPLPPQCLAEWVHEVAF